MKYIIVIDKQSRTNPSTEKREYSFEVGEELRRKGDVTDDLVIENSIAKLIRRIGLTEYNVSYLLNKEVVTDLGEARLKLFEGDNYIYVKDDYNNVLKAEYIIKNDFTDTYITDIEMKSAIEQSATSIELSVNQKLIGYSTTEEMNSAIDISVEGITSEVVKKIAITGTNYLKNSDFAVLDSWTISKDLETRIEDEEEKIWLNVVQYTRGIQEIKQRVNEVKANIDYVVSLKARTELMFQNAKIGFAITFYDKKDEVLNSALKRFSNIGNGEIIQFTFKMPEKTSYVDFKITIENLSDDSCMFSITNAKLEIGTTATEWSLNSNELATKMELSSKITQTAEQINAEVIKKVDNDEFSTKLSMDFESVQIAWNMISEYIQFINAQLQIRDSDKKLLMALTQNGQKFWKNGNYVGNIGTNELKTNSSKKGLEFDLDMGGHFMTWAVKKTSSSDTYTMILSFAREGTVSEWLEGLHLGTDLYTNNNSIFLDGDVRSKVWNDGAGFAFNNVFTLADLDSNAIMDFSRGYEINSYKEINMHGYSLVNCANFSSDGRLKKSIYNSKISAVDRIKQIQHREFIWKDNGLQEQIGYIAQELEKIDSNYVKLNEEKDLEGNVISNRYEVKLLPLLSTATKAIQEQQIVIEEQQNTINKQQKFIKLMAEKLNMTDLYDETFKTTMAKTRNIKVEQETIYDGQIESKQDKKVIEVKAKQMKMKKSQDGEVEIIEEEVQNG